MLFHGMITPVMFLAPSPEEEIIEGFATHITVKMRITHVLKGHRSTYKICKQTVCSGIQTKEMSHIKTLSHNKYGRLSLFLLFSSLFLSRDFDCFLLMTRGLRSVCFLLLLCPFKKIRF